MNSVLCPEHLVRPAGRIRLKNVQAIIAAAEVEFARHGFKGTSMNTIAQNVGLPKANLHYYFNNKLGLYLAVLSNILELWDSTFNTLTVDDDPAEALERYIRAKMALSITRPHASRVFANELLHGAAEVGDLMRGELRTMVREKAAVLDGWIAAGRMAPVDSTHLFFTIWAATQTYADFEAQVCAVLGRDQLTAADHARATTHVVGLVLRGCGLDG